jgi:hypothetical protein
VARRGPGPSSKSRNGPVTHRCGRALWWWRLRACRPPAPFVLRGSPPRVAAHARRSTPRRSRASTPASSPGRRVSCTGTERSRWWRALRPSAPYVPRTRLRAAPRAHSPPAHRDSLTRSTGARRWLRRRRRSITGSRERARGGRGDGRWERCEAGAGAPRDEGRSIFTGSRALLCTRDRVIIRAAAWPTICA